MASATDPVERCVRLKHASPAWRTNAYRHNGTLRPDAFARAFERCDLIDSYTYRDHTYGVWHVSAWSHADLEADLARHTPLRYNLKSAVFTYAEMEAYLAQRHD